jgi:hypothetical protein
VLAGVAGVEIFVYVSSYPSLSGSPQSIPWISTGGMMMSRLSAATSRGSCPGLFAMLPTVLLNGTGIA